MTATHPLELVARERYGAAMGSQRVVLTLRQVWCAAWHGKIARRCLSPGWGSWVSWWLGYLKLICVKWLVTPSALLSLTALAVNRQNQSAKHLKRPYAQSAHSDRNFGGVWKLLNPSLDVGTTRHHSHSHLPPLATALNDTLDYKHLRQSTHCYTIFIINFVFMNKKKNKKKRKMRKINGSLGDKLLPSFIHNLYFFFIFFMELQPNESINMVTNMETVFANVELVRPKVNSLWVLVRVLELLLSTRMGELSKEFSIVVRLMSFWRDYFTYQLIELSISQSNLADI